MFDTVDLLGKEKEYLNKKYIWMSTEETFILDYIF